MSSTSKGSILSKEESDDRMVIDKDYVIERCEKIIKNEKDMKKYII